VYIYFVTCKVVCDYRRGVWIGNLIYWTLPPVTIHYGAVANSLILQLTTAHAESSRSAISSPVLWYQLSMADVSLPLGSRTVLRKS
jgi:hypothetical protein